jgi:transcription initiation factor TFIIH subunit 4
MAATPTPPLPPPTPPLLPRLQHLLLFLVGSIDTPPPPPSDLRASPLDVASLLLAAGLVVKDDATQRPGVTQAGFQFLLTDSYSQLWRLLREYIATAERQSSAELASVISFLLQLGFQGQRSMRAGALPPLERGIAAHMAQLGLLRAFRAGGEVWLCPTRLAVTMAGGAGASAGAAADGFVVTETNFRLYAYTASPVRQAILRLFVRCDVLLPNLFVGTITRESVTAALDSGVGAEQVVAYLRQHAHPRVAARVPVVPGVVADQIRLWQRELQRLAAAPGVLYKAWESAELYAAAADFAQSIGATLLRDDAAQTLVAASHAHDQMRAEIRALKQKLGL